MSNKDSLIRNKKKQIQSLLKANRLHEARDLCRDICAFDKNDAETWFLLGTINEQLGSPAEAVACYHQTISLQPNHAEAYYHVGVVLRNQSQLQEAAECLRQATRIKTNYFDALRALAAVLIDLGAAQEAVATLRSVLQLKPSFAEAHANLGSALYLAGMLEEAVTSFRKAISLKPGNADLHDALANLLCYQGKIDEAIIERRRAVQLSPDNATLHSNLLFTLHYKTGVTPSDLFDEHMRWATVHGQSASPHPVYANLTDPERQLRIGYVSPNFYNHSVSFFIEPVLANHNHAAFEVICYSDVKRADATTERLRKHASQWRHVVGMSDARLRDLIISDRIDILVDLAGHTRGNRLRVFAQKAAPVQVSYLGYPNTTGLPTVDFRLTDAMADPVGTTENFCTETLFRLHGCFLCYQPPSDAPPVAAPPFQATGCITFGSFNNVAKINPEIIGLWARILHAVPNSRFILKFQWQSDIPTRERYISLFATHGIDRDRLDFLPNTPSAAEHLGLYSRMDIALDTFPYNGTTTTCDALWMGVPVISLTGSMHMSRVGMSLLTCVGLPEYIGTTTDEYVGIAVRLAGDKQRLTQLRVTLRDRVARSPLCDAIRFTREIEAAYRDMWKTWCKK